MPVSMQDGNQSTMDMLMMTKSKCGFYVHSSLTTVQVCKCQWACKAKKQLRWPLYFSKCSFKGNGLSHALTLTLMHTHIYTVYSDMHAG